MLIWADNSKIKVLVL